MFHRLWRKVELHGDLGVAEPTSQEVADLDLSRGETEGIGSNLRAAPPRKGARPGSAQGARDDGHGGPRPEAVQQPQRAALPRSVRAGQRQRFLVGAPQAGPLDGGGGMPPRPLPSCLGRLFRATDELDAGEAVTATDRPAPARSGGDSSDSCSGIVIEWVRSNQR